MTSAAITVDSIWKDVETIRKTSPLVHNITNYVVMNTTANALLALGASPVMAHAEDEAADMAGIASALVINIGTLSQNWINAMLLAAQTAGDRHIPIILDPVGAGATAYRTGTALKIIRETPPGVIRGNGSEIMALCDLSAVTKGVDSTRPADLALGAAKTLNRDHGSVVCITGEIDYIVGKSQVAEIKNGHAMMPRVTGMGCTATAVCGAFTAVNKDSQSAVAHAMAVMGIAGEMAGQTAKGPGSFQSDFLDALYRLDRSHIASLFKE